MRHGAIEGRQLLQMLDLERLGAGNVGGFLGGRNQRGCAGARRQRTGGAARNVLRGDDQGAVGNDTERSLS
jgi:hypothetical protein